MKTPLKTRFFTLGSMGKTAFAESAGTSFGTRSPFREACRNCPNPTAQPGGEKSIKELAADATNRPALYRGTYWGTAPLEGNRDRITPEIIRNRNELERRWKLSNLLGWAGPYPERGRREDFDHPELYRDTGGRLVLVVSNYGGLPPGVLGMVRIAPVYARGVVSYVGRFASLRELRARLAACGEDKRPFEVRI